MGHQQCGFSRCLYQEAFEPSHKGSRAAPRLRQHVCKHRHVSSWSGFNDGGGGMPPGRCASKVVSLCVLALPTSYCRGAAVHARRATGRMVASQQGAATAAPPPRHPQPHHLMSSSRSSSRAAALHPPSASAWTPAATPTAALRHTAQREPLPAATRAVVPPVLTLRCCLRWTLCYTPRQWLNRSSRSASDASLARPACGLQHASACTGPPSGAGSLRGHLSSEWLMSHLVTCRLSS